jgi:preprotein translocase subunit YajC
MQGTILRVSDRSVEVELDFGVIVEFPKSLFRDGLFPGCLVKYQYRKFILVSEPDAETTNQDIFELWDSISTSG